MLSTAIGRRGAGASGGAVMAFYFDTADLEGAKALLEAVV
jgi:hypothetical protein